MNGPPAIPAAQARSPRRSASPLLLWVRTGTAQVRVDEAATLTVRAGEGVWMPAGSRREIVTEPGTVAFPLWPEVGGGPSETTRFEVPEGWQDWLIQQFNLQVTPFHGLGYSWDAIADLLRRPGSPPAAIAGRHHAAAARHDPPPTPKAEVARAVAEELLRDPALDLTIQQWAVRVLSSPRTLLRHFVADTGLTFEQWRLRCRLCAAVELLATGYGVDAVAARVGFASRNGFTRAFRQQYEMTPHEFTSALAVRPGGDRAVGDGVVRRGTDLVRMMRGDGTSLAPDLLPQVRTPPHANDNHVLSWVYRGSGYLDTGDQRYERQRGDATWIPAEIEHVTVLRQDSVSLPLGNASPRDLQLTAPLQVQFSPAWDDYLMFCSVSARSILQPDDYDPRQILDLFAEQVAAQRALEVPMPTEPHARKAALHYLRHIGEPDASAAHDLPTDLHRAFRTETGMTFSRWRYAARMRIARNLLAAGAKPSAIARRVGYAHLPTFTAAFLRFHGLSPREYQERETAQV
ncbi:MAG: helix-turn-helix domain-containing protein [Micropruina sp.]|uniref:helix-turn-helix transcriptional regulator n=1 Tax=Micropruina sp. TaxID=2737536 RepID=UPI0039E491C6